MRNTFVNTILDCFTRRGDLFIVSGDAGLGVFDEFQKNHASRFLNLGVAEQNTISFSAGLAMTGFKVFVYNIIPFVLYRCYEQVRNDVCYQKLPVVLVGIGSGITYSPQGMTHYSVEDIGIAQTLPNLTVISPADPVEARLAAKYALEAKEPVYVRLAKRGEPIIHKKGSFDITLPRVVEKGKDVAILFHGSISLEVLEAHARLSEGKIFPLLLSVPVLKPLNKEALLDILRKFKYVVVVEEHFENSGLGNIIKNIHFEYQPSWKLRIMGIPFQFIHEIKDTVNMRKHFGIAAGDIIKAVKEAIGR